MKHVTFTFEQKAHIVHKGLQDATRIIESQTDVIKETLYTMEEPTV